MKSFKKWMVVPFIEEKKNSSIISDQNINKIERLEILKRKSLNPHENFDYPLPVFKTENTDNFQNEEDKEHHEILIRQ